MPIVSCVFKTNMNVYLLRSTICSNIYLYVHTCIPNYVHWYACRKVYSTILTNMHYMNVLMYWCRSSLPRAPSLPGADLGSGTHHATTLAILSHCQHADGDGDGDWRSLFNADAHKNIIYQKLTPFVSHKRWALFVSESGKINPPLCFKFCHSF